MSIFKRKYYYFVVSVDIFVAVALVNARVPLLPANEDILTTAGVSRFGILEDIKDRKVAQMVR